MTTQEEIIHNQDKARIKRIAFLIEGQGHSYHCACRQVWGDGECECDMLEKEIDKVLGKSVPCTGQIKNGKLTISIKDVKK